MCPYLPCWVPRSRLYLPLSLDHAPRTTDPLELYVSAAILDTERSIEHLVRKVGITLESHMFLLDSFFAVLGHRLPRLQELSFTGSIFAGQFHAQITRRTCLHASLLASIASLSLHRVALNSFNDLARLLGTLTHLTHLTLHSITWLSYGTYSS